MKKTAKRLLSMMLCLCVLIGLPMSIQAVDNGSLTMTRVDIIEDKKVVITFSMPVNLPTGNYFSAVGIYKGDANGLFRFQWDNASDSPSRVAEGNFTGSSLTQWQVSGFAYYNEQKTQVVASIGGNWNYSDVLKTYNKITAELSIPARLVFKFDDSVAAQTDHDGINAVVSLDGTKKLQSTHILGLDWAQYNLYSGLQLTTARLYATDHAVLVFSKSMAAPAHCYVTYGLYKNGVLNKEVGVWTLDALNVFRNDATKLVGHLSHPEGKSLWEVSSKMTDHELIATVHSYRENNGLLEEFVSRDGTKKLAATDSLVTDCVKIKVSVRNSEKLFTLDRVFMISNTEYVLDFSHDINLDTAKYWCGVEIRNASNQPTWFKANGSGYDVGYRSSSDRAGWTRAMWDGKSFNYYNNRRDQVVFQSESYVNIMNILNGNTTENRAIVRFTEAVGAGTSRNGLIDSVVSANNVPLASTVNDNEDYAAPIIGHGAQLMEATLYTGGQLIVCADQAVSYSFGGATVELALYKDGVADLSKGSWVVSSAPYWHGTHNALLMEINASAILQALTDNPDYALGVAILSTTADTDGRVNEFKNSAGIGMIANAVRDGKDAAYTSVTVKEGKLQVPEHTSVGDLKILSEDEAMVTFTGKIAHFGANVEFRILDAADNVNRTFAAKATMDDQSLIVRLNLDKKTDKISNLSDLWEHFQSVIPDGRLVLAITQPDGEIDGLISSVRTESAGHLWATMSNSVVGDVAYIEITESYFDWNTSSFDIESVKQISPHTLLVRFTEDIELIGMDDPNKPFVSLRMVNDEGRLVRMVNGKPAVSGSGSYMQWVANTTTMNSESKRELLITWNYCDIGLLLSQSNMSIELQQYKMAFSFEEASISSELGNHLIHNIVRASDGKQFDGTFYLGSQQADSCLVFAEDMDLLDPQAELSVEGTEVLDQNRILISFSEAINLNKDTAVGYIRLVDKQFNVICDENGNPFSWGGRIENYDNAKTKAVFILDYSHRNDDYPITGLDDIVKAGLETNEYTLMLSIGDIQGNDGLIHSITAQSGKILAADPMNGSTDAIYLDFDKSSVPQGELTITEVKAISDKQVVITFSAPVNITDSPFMSVRWFGENNRMVWKAKDGEYVFSSKHNGESTMPMQWELKWEFNNKEQTQIIGTVIGGIQELANFTDFVAKDWTADVPGSRIVVGCEEKNEAAVNGTWHVENITLRSDPRIALSATISAGNYDGAYVPFAVDYNPKQITASAKVINDMQILVTYSQPVQMIGNTFAAIRFHDDEGKLLYWGDDFNRIAVQFAGTLKPVEESKTQMIWTMSGNNLFGCCNISDIVNFRYASAKLKGNEMKFCIEELNVEDVITVGGSNRLIDNIASLDGKNHLNATKLGGYDSLWIDVYFGALKGKNGVELLSVKAVTDQTIELTFSEAIKITDPDNMSMVIRYLTPSGDGEVFADGKTAQFKGNWNYKDENKNVIVWTLKSKSADSLTAIFNYGGNLKWNEGARIVFCLGNNAEGLPTKTMRIMGITALDGMNHLCAPLSDDSEIQRDVEIAYDKPERVEESDGKDEVLTKYVTNYIPVIIGGAVILAACVVVGIIISRKKEGK